MTLVFVVDGLDECDSEDDVGLIIQLFTASTKFGSFQLRLFVASRPELSIDKLFTKPEYKGLHRDVTLHQTFEDDTTQDIRAFLRRELPEVDDADLEALVKRAGGLFIYAKTACLFIKDDNWDQEERLSTLLTGDAGDSRSQTDQLDEMYTQILHGSITGKCSPDEKSKLLERFRAIVGCVVVLFQPLVAKDIANILQIRSANVGAAVRRLGSVMNVTQIQERPLQTLHPSFGDFLLDRQRCNDEQLWVDGKKTHTKLAVRCLELMSSYLKRDIFGLRMPGILLTEIKLEQVQQPIPAEIQYACVHWVHHLQRGCLDSPDFPLFEAVYTFLTQSLLYWLEALSLMRNMTSAVTAMRNLDNLLAVSVHCPHGNIVS